MFYFTQLKLEGRDGVSVREMALEEKKGEQTRDNNETESDSETLLGEKKKTRKNKRRGRRRGEAKEWKKEKES